MQSWFIGVGQTLANALPYVFSALGVVGVMASGIPLSVEYSFKIGAMVFLVAVLWTVLTTKEYPPEDMEAFERLRSEKRGCLGGFAEIASALAEIGERTRGAGDRELRSDGSAGLGECPPGPDRYLDRHRRRAGDRGPRSSRS